MTSSASNNSKTSHHHRSSLKQKNKPFKSSSSSSSVVNKGKVNKGKGTSTTIKNNLSKRDRKNRSVMILKERKMAQQELQRNLKGPSGVPRICLMVPLSACTVLELPSFCDKGKSSYYSVRCKQNLLFETLDRKENFSKQAWMLKLLDRISIADCIIFTSSATEMDGPLIDEIGYEAIDIISKTGISSSIALLNQSSLLSSKELLAKKAVFLASLKSQIGGTLSKVHLDTDDSVDMERCLCNQSLNEISWRRERPLMMVDNLSVESASINTTYATMTGFIRGGGKPFHPDRLVHIPSLAKDFEVHQITYEDGAVLYRTSDTAESLYSGIVCDGHNYDTDNNNNLNNNNNDTMEIEMIDDANSETDVKDIVMMDSDNEEDSFFSSTTTTTTMKDSNADMIDFVEHEEKRKLFLSERHFKDEIEFDLNRVRARERLHKYRGVQSLRTSQWNKLSSLPAHYSSIFHFQNPKQSKTHALNDDPFNVFEVASFEMNHSSSFPKKESNKPKLFSKISIKIAVSAEEAAVLQREGKGFTLFGLLKHEQKRGVINFTIDTKDKILRNKERVLAVIGGFRRTLIEPLLSEHSNNNLNKMLRSSQGVMVGTCCSNISYEGSPVLLFRGIDGGCGDVGGMEFVSSGSIIDNDPHRIILKRITLTGLPFKVQKKSAVVRFMFGCSEDVQWFKPVELVTKCGARGHIRESLGTHGYMKCLFDRPIFHHDIISMNLYKRVFPKPLLIANNNNK